jgi:hypothetical protein
MSEWIKVLDRLPDHKWVLLSNGERIWIGQIDSHWNKEFYCKCCLENFDCITHWMPLPEPPE